MRLPNLRGERGFTLMETLVAMLAGVIVTGATFAILDISLKQSSRLADRVSADQRGRLGLEKVLLELHSSCVSIGANPIQAESDGTHLKFLSKSGSSEPFFTSMTKHELYLSGNTLEDAVYQSTGGNEAKWTFPASATSTTPVLTGVSSPSSGSMFEYFKYTGTSLTTALKVPLVAADAKVATKVNVNFIVAPESGNTSGPAGDRSIELGDSVVMRLTPSSEVGGNEPCE
jgi:hypothetical protein